jgi:hypothetical protein
MVQEVTFSKFCDAFFAQDRGEQFSWDALHALYDYLEDLDPTYELDVVELCGEYVEVAEDDLDSNDYEIIAELPDGALCRNL